MVTLIRISNLLALVVLKSPAARIKFHQLLVELSIANTLSAKQRQHVFSKVKFLSLESILSVLLYELTVVLK